MTTWGLECLDERMTPPRALSALGLRACQAQGRGYIVLGVDEATLRRAVRHALGARWLTYEDRPGIVHVPSVGLDLKLHDRRSARSATTVSQRLVAPWPRACSALSSAAASCHRWSVSRASDAAAKHRTAVSP